LQAERDRLEHELGDLTIELTATGEHLARLQRAAATPPTQDRPAVTQPALSRAQRRQLEREQRRRPNA
jgi:cell division protein FtsL